MEKKKQKTKPEVHFEKRIAWNTGCGASTMHFRTQK